MLNAFLIQNMGGETLTINWDDFSATLAERFEILLREAKFSDVTLVSGDGQKIFAHQAILATGSIFFKNLLEAESRPLIFMRRVDSSLLKPLLNFLYIGKAQVREDLLTDFVALGADLGVEGLANLCDLDQRGVHIENGEKEEYNTVSEEKYNTMVEEKYNTVSEEKNNTVSEENNASLQEVAKKPVSKSRENRIDGTRKKQMKYHRELPKTYHTDSEKIVVPIKDENGFHKCNYCERKISDKSNFKKHIRADHLMIVLRCKDCDYSTKHVSNLTAHVKKAHIKRL